MTIEKRTYRDAEAAKATVAELQANGFLDVRAWFKPDLAGVAVDAPFGRGQTAVQVLDRHEPVISNEELIVPDVFPPKPVARARTRYVGTPLSDFFGWPVLSQGLSPFAPKALMNDPAPLSRLFGWMTVSSLPAPPARAAPPAKPAPAKPPVAQGTAGG